MFSSLRRIPLEKQIFEEIKRYVCIMYGFKRIGNINDVIKSIFEEKSKPTISLRPLKNIKSIDPTKFPQCKVILEQQTKRDWFIAHLSKTAVEAYPAINHTHLDKNHAYSQFKWFKSVQVPPQLELIDTDIDTKESEDEIHWDSDNENELSSDDQSKSLLNVKNRTF